ncbi:SusC/RagA family TonB-linked outer membrane protein [Chitinophaga sp. SYP-B3965]|uniref:SusC/RagA family TonB-linked outer membrane protein n=1 Tax=Chitinophaga sp. SYP-B3965 TaxID=2663120 RepID=UPI001299A653|nr:TonB-dependent receptor [Chitinophaga sp. SYP-B3965]MRG45138.1 SusC/RagA family TonB-linked outer membrane protein [Chitinophaga sp. SYP-B3965]
MKFLLHGSIFSIFLLLLGTSLFAQQRVVSGTVKDEANGALPGATIRVKNATAATVTDAKGNYSLAVPDGAILVFTFTGYETQEIAVQQRSSINITLKNAATNLTDVVVIGYGVVRKRDLTGTVASIKGDQLSKSAVNSLEQGLQGRLAGVAVTQNDAAPGGGISIQIRGTSSLLGGTEPLYVIDGVPVANARASLKEAGPREENHIMRSNTNALSTISPGDIESIEVLKDASATAIYGSRGANGVVLITTKKGKSGKGKITFNTSQGFATVTKKIDMLNAYEYAQYLNEAYTNAGFAPGDLPYSGTNGKLTPDQVRENFGEGVNWQDVIYRNAYLQDYELGVSGGSEKNTYAVMGNYLAQEGAIKGSLFKRGGLRLNLDNQVNDRVKTSTNLSVSRSTNALVRTAATTSGQEGGIVRSALNYSPIPYYRRNTNGDIEKIDYLTNREVSQDMFDRFGASPLRYTDEVKSLQTITSGFGGFNAYVDIVKGLMFQTRLGANYFEQLNETYFPRTVNEGRATNGKAIVSNSSYYSLLTENLLTYRQEIGKHRFDFLGGFSYEKSTSRYRTSETRDFADDKLGYNDLFSGLSTAPTLTGRSQWQLASFIARANYSYADKYLFTYTFRSDGSSRLAKKWQGFSSVALAWRLSEEPFIKETNIFSDLKLRASYGESGNQAVSPYSVRAKLSGVIANMNNAVIAAVDETTLPNKDLKWETTSQYNFGLDAAFHDRFNFSVNLYQRKTRDLLQQITQPPSTGYNTVTVNSGNVTNKGIELELGSNIFTGDFKWNVAGNISFNRNEITDLGELQEQFADRLGAGYGLDARPFIQKVGLPIGTVWGFVEDGIFQNQAEVDAFKAVQLDAKVGQTRYKDLNDDKQLNDLDREQIGDVNPDFNWGFTTNFSYKNFDLSVLISGVQGNDVLHTNRMNFHTLNGSVNIPQEVYDSRWRGEGTSNTIIQPNQANITASRFSRQFLEDGSYVRIKNIQLGYTFPKIRGISNLRMYFNAINLFTFTNYSGYDPEVSAFENANMRGVDLGSYPQSRTLTVGLNVTF